MHGNQVIQTHEKAFFVPGLFRVALFVEASSSGINLTSYSAKKILGYITFNLFRQINQIIKV